MEFDFVHCVMLILYNHCVLVVIAQSSKYYFFTCDIFLALLELNVINTCVNTLLYKIPTIKINASV